MKHIEGQYICRECVIGFTIDHHNKFVQHAESKHFDCVIDFLYNKYCRSNRSCSKHILVIIKNARN